jgi:ribosome-binding protein aMBF1 (putative translation factor)
MPSARNVAEWMAEKGIGLDELIAASGMDDGIVRAIAECRYTPSPEQRQRLSAALGVEIDAVVWGHRTPVMHIYGHGPQFGRTP